MNEYQAGVCNINQEESKKRYLTGIISLIAGLLLSSLSISFSAPYILIFAFMAFTFGTLGILQGNKNFCVQHAKSGTQKTDDKTEEISDKQNIEKDNKIANKMIIKSLGIGLIAVTSIYVANIYIL